MMSAFRYPRALKFYRVETRGRSDFTVSIGASSANFNGEDLGFLSVINIYDFADRTIEQQELSPREQTELAHDVLYFIHKKATGRREQIRIQFELPIQTAAASDKKRFLQIRRELFASISNMADEYVRKQKAKAAPLGNNAVDTIRTRYLDDDVLFTSDLIRISGTDVEKKKIIDGLRERTARTVFRDFSGEEYHLFLKIHELWFRQDRPEKIEMERDAFLSELGIDSAGGALFNKVEKIKGILNAWSKREAFKIISPPDETGGIDFTGDCYLPRWREYRAKKHEIGKKTRWIFSDFDILLFGHSRNGYRKIATRPFALLTESLGNTLSADRAKHAVGIILTELAYGRKRPFKLKTETLRLTSEDFNRHRDLREKAIKEIVHAMSTMGIKISLEEGGVHVSPRF